MARTMAWQAGRSRREEVLTVGVLIALIAAAIAGCGDSRNDRTAHAAPPVVRPRVTTPEPVSAEPAVAVSVAPEPVSFETAEGAYRERRYQEATELFSRYVDRESENPWGFYMLGLSAWKSGDAERAEAAFGRALELDPRHVKSLVNLSRVLLEGERAGEALEHLERAQTLDSLSGEVVRLRGVALHDLGRVEEAIEAYRRAIVLDQGDAWAMNNLGLLLIQQERFWEALGPLARATELRNDIPVFQNNLGVALERGGHFVAAAVAYRAALEADATYGKASVNLARVDGREDEPGVVPVDLELLAQQFVAEIAQWGETSVADELPTGEPSDTVVAPLVVMDSLTADTLPHGCR